MKRNILLIVDDSELDLAILNEIFRRDFEVKLLSDVHTALAFVSQHKSEIAAAIVDVKLAKNVSGLTLLQRIHSIEDAKSLPVVLITSDAHEEVVLQGIEYGAIDFLVKPVDPLSAQERLRNVVATAWANEEVEDPRTVSAAPKAITAEEAEALFQRWQTKLMQMCQHRHIDFSNAFGHIKILTLTLAETYIRKHPDSGLRQYDAKLIGFAAGFADIGLLALPDYVVMAGQDQPDPGKSLYYRHPVIGHFLLDNGPAMWDPFLTYCKEIALYHHEEYDGSGVPSHLAGKDIPLSAQFVHTAMILDDLLHQFALNEDAIECILLKLEKEAGVLLSFEMLDTIAAATPELESIRKSYRNSDKPKHD